MGVDGTICAIAIHAARVCPDCSQRGLLMTQRDRACKRCLGSTPDSPVVRIMLASRPYSQRAAGQHSLIVRSPRSANVEDWQDLIGRELWGDRILSLGRHVTWARRVKADEIELLGDIIPREKKG